MHGFSAARQAGVIVASLAFAACSLPAQAQYYSLDGARHSGPATAESGTRFVRLPDGAAPASAVLAGRSVLFDGTSAMIGASSDAVFVAVARGSAKAGDVKAGPGEALMLQPYGRSPSVVSFDAGRMAAMFGPQPPETLQGFVADLAAIADEQSVGIFFGLYQRTLFDLQNPGGPRIEGGRASVMGAPEVVRIRYSGVSDPAQIEAMVIERARAALVARDANALAQLLDPAPYGGDDLSGGGDEARLLVARELTAQYGGQAARNATLRTRPFSDFVFVSSVE